MQQGHFAAHIRRMRQLYRDQRDALAETLMGRAADRLEVVVPDQGMHLVAYLRDGSSPGAAPPNVAHERGHEMTVVVRLLLVRLFLVEKFEFSPQRSKNILLHMGPNHFPSD
jgi:GntR family transcriptional regulator/MocR family aminotransferase